MYCFQSRYEPMKAIFFIFGCTGSSLLHKGLLWLQQRSLLSSCALASLVAEPTLEALGLQQLQRTGLVAPRRVASSQTRGHTCVPCTGRQIFICCVTREVHDFIFNYPPPPKNYSEWKIEPGKFSLMCQLYIVILPEHKHQCELERWRQHCDQMLHF